MKLEASYQGTSAIVSDAARAHVGFATNTLREASFFKGELGQPLVFREGLAALHSVVVSDLRFRPRDRLEFRAWLDEQDRRFLASLATKGQKAVARIRELEARQTELDEARLAVQRPFHEARRRYFAWALAHQYELSYLLDPVVTIHPDELSFEAFSRDESSYARLALSHAAFKRIDAFECGTTNIDFSARLHDQLERLRTYRETNFAIGPTGLAVQVGDAPVHHEKKIDLPDSWVMGFLQVHSVMTMGLTRVRLAPIDLFNLLRTLKRRKARTSPRALRWELIPGERVRVVLEPWEQVLELGPQSTCEGPKPISVRTWGRDRLQTLARLIPVAEEIDLYLAGTGLPSVWVLDLGRCNFTLGLSGWTENDWASGHGKFDLLTRKRAVSEAELTKTFEALRQRRFANGPTLAQDTGLSVDTVKSAVSYLCQVGRAMVDLAGGVFRHRELFLEPFVPKGLVAGADAALEKKNPAAAKAKALHSSGDVRIIARRPTSTGFKLSGNAAGPHGRVRPQIELDLEGNLVTSTCTCRPANVAASQGPCEHILGLRLAHMARLDEEQKKGGGSAGT